MGVDSVDTAAAYFLDKKVSLAYSFRKYDTQKGSAMTTRRSRKTCSFYYLVMLPCFVVAVRVDHFLPSLHVLDDGRLDCSPICVPQCLF